MAKNKIKPTAPKINVEIRKEHENGKVPRSVADALGVIARAIVASKDTPKRVRIHLSKWRNWIDVSSDPSDSWRFKYLFQDKLARYVDDVANRRHIAYPIKFQMRFVCDVYRPPQTRERRPSRTSVARDPLADPRLQKMIQDAVRSVVEGRA